MKGPNLSLHAVSEQHLLFQLNQIDITVPLVTEGRTKEHREQYMMARLLSTKAAEFKYPLDVRHTDGPDFILKEHDKTIGVECVEAVPQQLYQIEVLREREYPDALNFGQRFEPGKNSFSREQLRLIAAGELAGPPWMPDIALENWVEAMNYFLNAKTEKLRKGNYPGLETMWLLIQDEWPNSIHFYPHTKYSAARSLAEAWSESDQGRKFSQIFIASGPDLISIQEADARILAVRNLWG